MALVPEPTISRAIVALKCPELWGLDTSFQRAKCVIEFRQQPSLRKLALDLIEDLCPQAGSRSGAE